MQKPQILYLDNHLLVVNKPAGMPVQADETGDLDVQSWGKLYLKERFNKPGNVFLGLVHRLDRPVSGVLIMARTSKSAERLSAQIRERKIQKTYWALVEGETPLTAHCQDYLLKTDKTVQMVSQNHPQAQFAELTYERLKTNGKISLLAIHLITGRKHQIRIQLSNQNHSIIGDIRYGSKLKLDGRNLALCCKEMKIEHPTTKEEMLWDVEMPKSWLPFLKQLPD